MEMVADKQPENEVTRAAERKPQRPEGLLSKRYFSVQKRCTFMANPIFGAGAILLAILIAATEGLKWPRWLYYVWAAVSLVWGILAFVL